ncbi:HAMP domain-containing histidine kinase, partial [Sulfurimonas sp. SAG-AH-194-C20]
LEIERDKVKVLNSNLESRVEKEVEKNRIQDQLMLQQSRLAQMGEMISMIAHQWRQPLASIGSTSISIGLKADLNKLDKETAKELSTNISTYVQYLSSTIDDFRNFFKPNKEKKETSYDELIKAVFSIAGASVKTSNIHIILEQNSKETFLTYPNEIKQVILNLIKNAEDALVQNNVAEPYIKLYTYQKDTQYILEVSDNGGGISDKILTNIFDPYFSTKTTKDGTGLGLYMSKIIIEEHCKGSLNVFNNEKGALFQIILNKDFSK